MPLWKRSADVVLSTAALPALLVAVALMALLHRLVSPGAVFFCQERIGRNGRTFRIYKFRTMRCGANPASHQAHLAELIAARAPLEKLDRLDGRIIPGGVLLRATGLDELPQLLNVLLGQMSLVGPRPCMAYEYEKYGPHERRRFAVAPGLTGLWQVSGKNATTFERMVELDLEYVDRRSIWLDVKILLLTLPAVMRQVGERRLPTAIGKAMKLSS